MFVLRLASPVGRTHSSCSAPLIAALAPALSLRSRCSARGPLLLRQASRSPSATFASQHDSIQMADPRNFQTGGKGRLHVHEGILPPRAKGAVFDMDGTLLDTNDRRVESWSAACSKRGLRMDKATYMALTGMAGNDIVDKLCADQGVDLPHEERQALVQEESRLFKEHGLPRSPAVSPVLDVLEEAQRRGMRLAVCSGGRKDLVERSLAERGLADRFHAVVTSADVQHAKPEPDIFLLAADKLGLSPQDCVAFEDAEMGKRSARAAGYMAVVDVTTLPGHPEAAEGAGGAQTA